MPKKRKLTRCEKHARRHDVTIAAHTGNLRLPSAVREIRDSLGLTQAEFAGYFGLTRKQVLELEKGTSNPTLETLNKIGKPFGFVVGFVRPEGAKGPFSTQE